MYIVYITVNKKSMSILKKCCYFLITYLESVVICFNIYLGLDRSDLIDEYRSNMVDRSDMVGTTWYIIKADLVGPT